MKVETSEQAQLNKSKQQLSDINLLDPPTTFVRRHNDDSTSV